MPAPSRKALTGNSPRWRHRNRLQVTGSPQLRNLCTAEGSKSLAQQGQHTTLPAGAWFIRIRGLQRGRGRGNLDEGGRDLGDPEGG